MSRLARHSICGRADLVRALAEGGPELLNTVAGLLELKPLALAEEDDAEENSQGVGGDESEAGQIEKITPAPLPASVNVPFWRIETYQANEVNQKSRKQVRKKTSPVQWRPPDLAPEHDPLASWPAVLPRLRQAATERTHSRQLDIDATVKHLGRGEWLQRLPQRQHRRWGYQLQVISDRSHRLIPYWQDQDLLVTHLQRHFPQRMSEEARYLQGFNELVILNWQDKSIDDYVIPPAGSLVVVLSDLGSFARRPAELLQQWLLLGRQLIQAGCRPVALIPGVLKRCPAELSRYWTLLPWYWPQGELFSDEVLEQQIEHLLILISPAIRIEPGFLRGVRRLLGAEYSDAALEAEVWQHPAMMSKSSVAGTLNPKTAQRLRQQFEQLPGELQNKVLNLLRRWRVELPQEIWFEEIRDLGPRARNQLPDPSELDLQRQFFASLGQDSEKNTSTSQLEWFVRMNRRLSARAWEDPQGREGLNRLWHAVYGNDPDRPRPIGFDPADISNSKDRSHPYQITQQNNRLQFAPANNELKGSPIGTINAGLTLLNLEQIPFWKNGTPPDWASSWGADDYGPWVSFDVTADDGRTVSQRMRWIPAGRFMMGSPEDEAGRDDNEGPQHEVTISQGYWMFDTPCTQALWELVMDENPSRFNDPQRPVEQVSWENIQTFLEKINKQISGLELTLPNEAQWEYACRAGTTAATYAGDLEILGQDNAPILDDIAWYGGNSGHEFDREDGEDTTGWGDEKQYPHTSAGSRKVAQKKPNPWGLYDTLGNVFEWCLDGLRDYESAPIRDPAGSSNQAASRVFRGGSWNDYARNARAAYRYADEPGIRYNYLGFRAARVQVGAEPGAGAEPPGRSISRQPERREMTEPSGAAGGRQVRLDQTEPKLILPESGRFVIRSDREQLGFGVVTKPQWAKAIGRDRFGLWVDIEVDTVVQRMRWISPGQFLMGSLESEISRTDRERPQHNVILSKGYWLFDTPCTRALWRVVMEKSPSEYQGSQQPMEGVSWLNVQEFLQKINERVDGLYLTLPTEAQWEYACRAGMTTAIYADDLEVLGDFGAPLLNDIVWYGGNTDDPESTRPVGQKQANQWGLYDMLGNVFEWCLDGMRDYETKTVIDPLGPNERTASRVVRGGSWPSSTRNVRTAGRSAYEPSYRHSLLGFRAARVQD